MVLSFLIVILFITCTGTDTENPEGTGPEIRIANEMNVHMDSLCFRFEIPAGLDSIRVVGLNPDQNIQGYSFVGFYNYYRNPGDLFLLKSGWLVTGGEKYYLSNCFCDPDLKKELITEGIYTIRLKGIDPLRKELVYEIQKNP